MCACACVFYIYFSSAGGGGRGGSQCCWPSRLAYLVNSSERPCLRKQGGWCWRNDTQSGPVASTCIHVHIAHIHMCICTHMNIHIQKEKEEGES